MTESVVGPFVRAPFIDICCSLDVSVMVMVDMLVHLQLSMKY